MAFVLNNWGVSWIVFSWSWLSFL